MSEKLITYKSKGKLYTKKNYQYKKFKRERNIKKLKWLQKNL